MTKETPSISIPLPGIFFFLILLAILAFYSGIAFSKNKLNASTDNANSNAPAYEPKKSDKPELQFYVMSFCPFGNQIEDVIKPVVDLLGDKASIKPQYIFEKIENIDTYCKSTNGDVSQCATYVKNKYFTTEAECQKTITANVDNCLQGKELLKTSNGSLYASLHGRQEANQDLREICAYNQASNKKDWWNFIDNVNKNCTSENADSCWEEQAKKANLDPGKINECFNKEAVDLIEKEIALTTQYNVSGSPTVMINNQIFPPESAYTQNNNGSLKIGKTVFTQNQYRTPEALKAAVCAAFNKPPKECNTQLANSVGTDAPAAGGCN